MRCEVHAYIQEFRLLSQLLIAVLEPKLEMRPLIFEGGDAPLITLGLRFEFVQLGGRTVQTLLELRPRALGRG